MGRLSGSPTSRRLLRIAERLAQGLVLSVLVAVICVAALTVMGGQAATLLSSLGNSL